MNCLTGEFNARRALAAFALAIAAIFSLGVANSQAGTWSAPIEVDSAESGYNRTLPDVALADGSTAVSWVKYSASGSSDLVTKRVNRDGSALGPEVVVQSLPSPSDGSAWFGRSSVVALPNGNTVFAWFEHRLTINGFFAVEGYALKTRSVNSSGNAGGISVVSQNQIAEAQGSHNAQDLDLDANPRTGTTSLAWGIGESRGTGCNSYYSSSGCVNRTLFYGTQLNGDGAPSAIVTLSDTVVEYLGSMHIETVSSDAGPATAIYTVSKRRGGSSGDDVLYRSYDNGSAGNVGMIGWSDYVGSFSSGIDSAGNISVAMGSRIARINADGSATRPVQVADSGENDTGIADMAIYPDGAATATWSSYDGNAAGDNQLVFSVWTNQLNADGTVGAPNLIRSESLDNPAESVEKYLTLTPSIGVGIGQLSGAIGISSQQYSYDYDADVTTNSGSYMAGELGADGEMLNLTALGSADRVDGDVTVSTDGTVGAAWRTNNMSSTRETTLVSKLTRDPVCGVNPANCKPDLSSIVITPKKKTVKAGAKVKFTVKVKNTGQAPASKVTIKFKSSNKKVKVPKAIKIASIAPGATAGKSVTLKIGKGAKKKVKLTASLAGKKAKSATANVKIKSQKNSKGKKGKGKKGGKRG